MYSIHGIDVEGEYVPLGGICLYNILRMTSILDFPWFFLKSNVTYCYESIFDLMCINMMITDVY